ncbi:hypothetical protein GCM10010329_51790 [Streptomyces spiroverticillatus]|uniref:ANTAR domain-containing protein n=1 Tax=Streptomyces finlayi TaxID=67296 RepID=A0A918X201_9ACTN|nr:GAF and ANTAR domain-containing protein [Streptomyces finlayi]GHA22105.1 hypothetical protein GCM10010329_51790 [Streptomyces spiroverticillatus]GHD04205.1 hypothetical protein GCM10010334_52730 [Streptomyces finlayi]
MISNRMGEVLARLDLHEDRPTDVLGAHCTEALGVDHLVVSLALDEEFGASGRGMTFSGADFMAARERSAPTPRTAAGEQLWSTSRTGSAVDDLQFTLGEGPEHDTLRTCRAVLENDLDAVDPDRWPTLLPALAELPVRALFCLPLCLGGITPGVLTVLRETPGPMSGQQMEDALALAEAITFHLLTGGADPLDAWIGPQCSGELHRAVVHQAAGMVSVQLDLPLDDALARIRAHAYRCGEPVTRTADDIVNRRIRLSHDPPARDLLLGPPPDDDPSGTAPPAGGPPADDPPQTPRE